MRKPLISLVFTLALTASAAAVPPKQAPKDKPKAAAPKAPKPVAIDQARLSKVLETGTEAEIKAALAEIRQLGPSGAAAAPLVNALLTRGANAPVLVDALDTAGALGVESSSEAVAPYVLHRKREIRKSAADALALTRGPVAVKALRRGLGSADPVVRASAARGLGRLGASAAVDDLFTVLEHETPEAAVSIAILCTPSQCDRLMALVGKLKFDTLEPAFVPLLLRPASALPDPFKLRYIDRLRRLATQKATTALETAKIQLGDEASPTLRAAFEAALRERPIATDSP